MKNTNEKAEEHSSLKKIEEIFTKKYNVQLCTGFIYLCVQTICVCTQSGEKNKAHKTNLSKC